MKNYIVVFSDHIGTSLYVSNILRAIPEISSWRYDMQHSIHVKSELNSNELYKKIKSKIPQGRFFISEITDNRQGYITKKTWEFLKG